METHVCAVSEVRCRRDCRVKRVVFVMNIVSCRELNLEG